MIEKKELIEWLQEIPELFVAIDEGGLAMVGVVNEKETESYIEVGGVPEGIG